MSNQADIRDIQILGDLKAAFGQFGEDVLQVLPAIEKQFEEIQEQLEERQDHWRRQVDEAKDQVHVARRALATCEDSGYYDDEGDYQAPECGLEENQVNETERHLAECEENLETVRQWRHRIEGQIADFQSDMHRLSNLASSRKSAVQVFLANKIEILDRYVGGSSIAVGTGGLQEQKSHAKIANGSIPELIDAGEAWKTLPPGIHTATLVQIQSRFATNPKRKLLFDGFKRGIVALQQAGCKTVYLDGSFTSDKPEPGDFDACWDPNGVDTAKLDSVFDDNDFHLSRKRQKEVFQGEFFPSSDLADGERKYLDFFQIGRDGNSKGVLKIQL